MALFRIFVLAAAGVSTAAAPIAQTLAPKFEVASIRLNRDQSVAPNRLRPILEPGGRVYLRNQTLREIILAAYGVNDNELVGGPDWIRSTDFDVDARGPAGVSADTARAMLRELLADRFSLAVHREQRELPIYVLTLAARDGQRGPRLRPAGAECAALTRPQGMPPPPPPPAALVESIPLFVVGAPPRCPSMFLTGHVSARAMSMDRFAQSLARIASRPVINRTGLTGEFDVDLLYTPDLTAAPGDAAAPVLTTAAQEQLGLKLEPQRGPVDVVVIDRVMMPTEN